MSNVVTRQLVASILKRQAVGWSETPDADELFGLLNLMARWRSRALANTFVSREGPRILHGPFAGMAYVEEATEGALIPRLLGTYESELYPHFDAICPQVDCVISTGGAAARRTLSGSMLKSGSFVPRPPPPYWWPSTWPIFL